MAQLLTDRLVVVQAKHSCQGQQLSVEVVTQKLKSIICSVKSLETFHTSPLVQHLTERTDSRELDLNGNRLGPFTHSLLTPPAVPLPQTIKISILLPPQYLTHLIEYCESYALHMRGLVHWK
ncbi:hypothetical protein TNCV_1692201 [Trichonephila clavipes]|nr:hypothetical protein TNCV_1692201 [Trichonephila clavipes]